MANPEAYNGNGEPEQDLAFDAEVLALVAQEHPEVGEILKPEPISRSPEGSRIVGQVTLDITQDDVATLFLFKQGIIPTPQAAPSAYPLQFDNDTHSYSASQPKQEDTDTWSIQEESIDEPVSEPDTGAEIVKAHGFAGLLNTVSGSNNAEPKTTNDLEQKKKQKPVTVEQEPRSRKKHPFLFKAAVVGVISAYLIGDSFTALSREKVVAAESSFPWEAVGGTLFSTENLNPFPGYWYILEKAVELTNTREAKKD